VGASKVHLRDDRYTTGIGLEGYVTIRLPRLESLIVRAARDFPTACYQLFIPDGFSAPYVPFKGYPNESDIAQAVQGRAQAVLTTSNGYSADWEGYPGQALSPMTSSSMDLDSHMTTISTPASSAHELEDPSSEDTGEDQDLGMMSLVVPPSALFTLHTWTRDTANTSTQDPRLESVNSLQDPTILEFQYQTRGSHCNVCVTHEHTKCVSQLIHLPH